jgi:hypothetical protein
MLKLVSELCCTFTDNESKAISIRLVLDRLVLVYFLIALIRIGPKVMFRCERGCTFPTREKGCTFPTREKGCTFPTREQGCTFPTREGDALSVLFSLRE